MAAKISDAPARSFEEKLLLSSVTRGDATKAAVRRRAVEADPPVPRMMPKIAVLASSNQYKPARLA